MDIHGYKKTVENTEKNIINDISLSDKNKKIILEYKRQLFIKGLSDARIGTCLIVLEKTAEKLNKDFDCLKKEDIEVFLEWVQRRDIEEWTKYAYRQILNACLTLYKLSSTFQLREVFHSCPYQKPL